MTLFVIKQFISDILKKIHFETELNEKIDKIYKTCKFLSAVMNSVDLAHYELSK